MTEINPYEVLQIADSDLWPDAFDPNETALNKFRPEDLAGLSRLLQSNDEIISSRGLYLFSELGSKAFPVLDDALKLVQHSHVRARGALIDGILCYPQKLSVPQVRQVLRLKDLLQPYEQGSEVVRGKAIVVLGNVEPRLLLQAIKGIPDTRLRTKHLRAVQAAHVDTKNVQQSFDDARTHSELKEAHSLARLIWATRERMIEIPPVYEENDFVAGTVVSTIQRIINRNLHVDDPIAWREKLIKGRRNNRSAS